MFAMDRLFSTGFVRGKKCFFLTLIAAGLLFLRVEEAHGRSYMFFHAHEDDEAILVGGWAYDRIHEAGSTFKLVIATAGETSPPHWKEWTQSADYKDYSGLGTGTVGSCMVNYGYYRMDNTLAAYTSLGLNPANIIFLGYGCEGIPNMWRNSWSARWTSHRDGFNQSQWTLSAPKYCYGLGYKSSVPYTGDSLMEDIKRLLMANKPDCIMIPDWMDNDAYLCDHAAVSEFVLECLYELREAGGNDWVSHVAINYSPATHWTSHNKAWAGGAKYNPTAEAPLLPSPWPQDLFPRQIQYFDTLGGTGKQKLYRNYPYELGTGLDYTCRKNDLIRGPHYMFSRGSWTQTDFSPASRVAGRRPDCSVRVRDAEGGLNLTVKPQYIYSRDGGKTWKGTPGLSGYYVNRSSYVMYDGQGRMPLAANNCAFWQTTNLTATLTRVDATIDFTSFNPGGGINDSYWAAEWVGWIRTPAASGSYEFYLDASDYGFVFVDNKKLVWDHMTYSMGTRRSGAITLKGNSVYPIHVGCCNYKQTAPGCRLFWKVPGEAVAIIPSANLLCGDCGATGTQQGTTDYVTVTAASVPFNQASLTDNKIKFMSLNMAGTMAESSVYTVMTGPLR